MNWCASGQLLAMSILDWVSDIIAALWRIGVDRSSFRESVSGTWKRDGSTTRCLAVSVCPCL